MTPFNVFRNVRIESFRSIHHEERFISGVPMLAAGRFLITAQQWVEDLPPFLPPTDRDELRDLLTTVQQRLPIDTFAEIVTVISKWTLAEAVNEAQTFLRSMVNE